MVSIQFLGAAGTVTGSKFFLKTPGYNILIDCGLFQGLKNLRIKNWEPLPINMGDINCILLTHAHLDHCGYIPLLVKSGYKGKIYMTPPTRDLTEIILLDSAKIQEFDAEKINELGYSKHKPALPLYNVKEAESAFKQFEIVDDDTWVKLTENIKYRFVKNGHILGSVYIELNCYNKLIVFSGDIGRNNSSTMLPPSRLNNCNYLIVESTYGDRLHENVSAKDELANIINETIRNKGNLLIPSFAVGRAQELMFLISELKREIQIPDIPVYLDSPMASKTTGVFNKFPQWHKLTNEQSLAMIENIHVVSNLSDTQKVIKDKGMKIIISASGMLTGGRVLEYLRNYISDIHNTILLVGYQAEGTRGRALRRKAHELKLYGKYYPVKAKVEEINSLSAHADQGELIEWLKGIEPLPQKIFLVHGEPSARDAFRVKIFDELKINSVLPELNDEVTLF